MARKASDYRVEWRREPAEGPVVAVEVRDAHTGQLIASTDDVEWLIGQAREIDTADPFDGGKLPSDRATLAAMLGDEIEDGDEDEAPAAPLMQRLAEAHDGLSDLSGLAVTAEAVEAVGDAYDALHETLAALRQIAALQAAYDRDRSPHDLLPEAIGIAKAAIAKAEGR